MREQDKQGEHNDGDVRVYKVNSKGAQRLKIENYNNSRKVLRKQWQENVIKTRTKNTKTAVFVQIKLIL